MHDIIISPNLYLAEEYTDNLLLEPSNEEADFLTTLYPNIGLRYAGKHLTFRGNYGHKFIYYKDNPEYDQTSFKDTLNSFASATVLPQNDFNVILQHDVQRASFGDRYTFNEENDLVNKTRRTSYRINPNYTFNNIRTFWARADYLYRKTEYDDSRGNDAETHQVTLRLQKDLNDREDTLRAELQGARVETEQYDNYERIHATVGGLLHLGPSWYVEGDIGRARIDPRNGSSFDITIGNLFLNYDEGATHARVGYAVTFPGSYDVDAYKTELAEAGIVFKKRAILGVHVRAKRDHYFEDNNEDESLRSTIRLDVPLSKRVWMDLTGDWSIYKFEPEDITDRRYGAGVGLYRVFRWGEAGILYRYNEQDSDDNSRDYASNYVRLYLNIPIY